jgi:hypothetical protein
VLPLRIELRTSPLPRECSTTELRQRPFRPGAARQWRAAGRNKIAAILAIGALAVQARRVDRAPTGFRGADKALTLCAGSFFAKERMTRPPAITRWHAIAAQGDIGALNDLLADDARFLSPVVHRPQIGKPLVEKYLTAALQVLKNETFAYRNEWIGETSAVLEFEATIGGISINGIDMITWNNNQKIMEFKVMIRPLKAINLIHQLMASMLEKTAQAS